MEPLFGALLGILLRAGPGCWVQEGVVSGSPWYFAQGAKGRAGQSQLLCVVMVVTQGAVTAGHRVAETGETGRMGDFSVEEG